MTVLYSVRRILLGWLNL